MIRSALLVGVLLLALLLAGEPAPVAILFAPHYVTEDTPITFQVRVQPNSANRLLVVAALDETGETMRRSDEQLDNHSRVTREIAWGPLSAGTYTLIAQAFDGAGKTTGRATSTVNVLEWRQ